MRELSKVPSSNVQEVINSLAETPDSSHRRSIALENPVEGAIYLKAVLDAFVEVINFLTVPVHFLRKPLCQHAQEFEEHWNDICLIAIHVVRNLLLHF